MKAQVDLKTWEMCKYFHLQASYGGSINIFATEVLFPLNLNPSGCGHVGSFFKDEEQKCWLVTFMTLCTLLPHTPSLFMMSQIRTARHKMVVLMAVFLPRTPNVAQFVNLDELELIFTPFKSVLCVELTL